VILMSRGAIDYWNVDLDLLQKEFNGYPAKPPAAFDVRLYTAAKAHCDDLIARDAQDHTGQFTRIDNAGFDYTYARGIVYSYAKSAFFGHAGFNIDWGPDGDNDPNAGSGVQPDRGHRLAIMSLDNPQTTNVVEDSDTNVGLAVVPVTDQGKSVGPLVITGDLCNARAASANQYNRFLVGTVWQDMNNNDQYDPGEGMGGVTVSPDHGTYYAVTADGGGYAIPITSAGTYDVTFHSQDIDPGETLTVTVASQSVLLDLLYTALPQVVTGNASDITTNAANLNGSVVTHGLTTDYYFEYGPSGAYGSATPTDSASEDSDITAAITGLAEDTVYHFRLVASNSQGTSYGDDQTFQTKAAAVLPPQATTGQASDIKTDAAILNGSVVTHGMDTDYYFEYGTSDAYGSATVTDTVPKDSDVTAAIKGLAEDTVYHFRMVASNSQGSSFGDDQVFRTSVSPPPSAPHAVTGDATGLTADTANLNGSVVTNGQAAEYFFQYGTTDAYGTDTPKVTVAVDSEVTALITGLAENTVYHYRLVASNSLGTGVGDDQTFQTTVVTPSGDTPDNPPAAGGSGGGGGGCFLQTALGYGP
jgi:uncharacterized protein YegP (UPF0339 family)